MRHTYANYPAESGAASSPNPSMFAAPAIVGQSGAPSAVTGTLAETVLASVAIPANAMGPNGVIRLSPLFSALNNANVKTVSFYFGGVLFANLALANASSYQGLLLIRNRASIAQLLFANLAGSGTSSPVITKAVDTTVDQVLQIRATLTNVGDTITLEGYIVEVLPGA